MDHPFAPAVPIRGQAGLPLLGLAALLALTSWLVAGGTGALIAAFAVAAALVWLPPLPPSRVMRWMRAQPIRPSDAPALVSVSRALANRAGLPAAPALYWLPSWMPNAMAVGDAANGAIGLSVGAVRSLTRREMQGVLAHEMAHLAAGDVVRMRLATVIAHTVRSAAVIGLVLSGGAILAGAAAPSTLGVMLLLAISPIAAAMLQSAASRDQEFAADRHAAALTGDPLGLASALHRIEQQHRRRLPSILAGGSGGLALLRSHPATAERVDRLLALRPAWPTGNTARPAINASAGPWRLTLAAR